MPDLTDDLLNTIDQPLQAAKDAQGNTYLNCDYNRDGDSYRSPWTNAYDPPIDDGVLPPPNLRRLEVAANDLFNSYREMCATLPAPGPSRRLPTLGLLFGPSAPGPVPLEEALRHVDGARLDRLTRHGTLHVWRPQVLRGWRLLRLLLGARRGGKRVCGVRALQEDGGSEQEGVAGAPRPARDVATRA